MAGVHSSLANHILIWIEVRNEYMVKRIPIDVGPVKEERNQNEKANKVYRRTWHSLQFIFLWKWRSHCITFSGPIKRGIDGAEWPKSFSNTTQNALASVILWETNDRTTIRIGTFSIRPKKNCRQKLSAAWQYNFHHQIHGSHIYHCRIPHVCVCVSQI